METNASLMAVVIDAAPMARNVRHVPRVVPRRAPGVATARYVSLMAVAIGVDWTASVASRVPANLMRLNAAMYAMWAIVVMD
jgi:hypothetical protein